MLTINIHHVLSTVRIFILSQVTVTIPATDTDTEPEDTASMPGSRNHWRQRPAQNERTSKPHQKKHRRGRNSHGDLDEDGDTYLMPAPTLPTVSRSHMDRWDRPQPIDTNHGVLVPRPDYNIHPERSVSTPRHVQEICRAFIDTWDLMTKHVLELGLLGDSEEAMEWQPEPTTPVYIAAMKETACYLDENLRRPWMDDEPMQPTEPTQPAQETRAGSALQRTVGRTRY